MTPSWASPSSHLARELLTERANDPVAGLEQDHPRAGKIPAPVLPPQRASGYRELTCDLHARRAAAHDDERQPLGAFARIVRALRRLEGAVKAVSQLDRVRQRLQPAGDVLPLVASEVRGLRAACHDQPVVVEAVATVENDLAAAGVDVDGLGHEDGRVGATLERRTDRRSAVARRQATSRHLVEQRLEQVVVRAVDERHVDVGVPKLVRGSQTAEPTADDHDPAPAV